MKNVWFGDPAYISHLNMVNFVHLYLSQKLATVGLLVFITEQL